LWGEVQDKMTEMKRRADVEAAENAAVQELLRLRASMSLPQPATNDAVGGIAPSIHLTAYKRAQREARQEIAAELRALAHEHQSIRQELIHVQGSFADEIAAQRLSFAQAQADSAQSLADAASADAKVSFLVLELSLLCPCSVYNCEGRFAHCSILARPRQTEPGRGKNLKLLSIARHSRSPSSNG